MKKIILVACCALVCAVPASAVIIWNEDANANTSADSMPLGLADYWDSVVQVGWGGAVYIGNGCFLTAKHILPKSYDPKGKIEINGINCDLDLDFGNNGVLYVEDLPGVASNDVELMVFRITNDPTSLAPNMQAAVLNTTTSDLNNSNSYIVGYGRGKGEPVAGGWMWADRDLTTKRWGHVKTYMDVIDDDYIVSIFDPAWQGGLDVAQGADNDSGGALFQKIGEDWVLSGINAGVSTLGAAMQGDATFYVRVSNYAGVIDNYITFYMGSVPEPSTWLLLGAFAAFAAFARRKRK